MRTLAVLALGLALTTATSSTHAMTPRAASRTRAAPAPVIKVEYFCSPGFVPTYGGRCVATEARSEIELYVNEPIEAPVVRHHRRHALHARY